MTLRYRLRPRAGPSIDNPSGGMKNAPIHVYGFLGPSQANSQQPCRGIRLSQASALFTYTYGKDFFKKQFLCIFNEVHTPLI